MPPHTNTIQPTMLIHRSPTGKPYTPVHPSYTQSCSHGLETNVSLLGVRSCTYGVSLTSGVRKRGRGAIGAGEGEDAEEGEDGEDDEDEDQSPT